ncbi:hypothetical protein FNV43_RR01900 [Rhamnella rubrinervis]|uniref:Uncharacterized protein n=1 Tax=Rhamnella rubrinervis TaxID=2594499 RepID=A0A8K0HT26_9ROSA|nr:hypothetical protein FNV43_RR01900 [Rhamnella rubrinervis]
MMKKKKKQLENEASSVLLDSGKEDLLIDDDQDWSLRIVPVLRHRWGFCIVMMRLVWISWLYAQPANPISVAFMGKPVTLL